MTHPTLHGSLLVPASERRGKPRVRIDADVGLEGETNFYAGFTFDISSGGLFVVMFDDMPAVGDVVALRFRLPGSVHIHVTARVAWSREESSGNTGTLPGVGLQFLDLPPAALEHIERFLRAREPIFHVM